MERTIHTRRWLGLAMAAVATFGLAACGGGEGDAGQAGGEDEAAAQEGPVVPADSQAFVRGAVSFEGTPPEAESIDMSQEPFCEASYGEGGARTQQVLVNDGQLENVFVYVKSGLDREFPAPGQAKELDQMGCRYTPHVMGLQVGQELAILNSDSLLHNINAKPTENRGFNISQPQAGMRTTRTFAVPEVMIPVECDVHGWMNAYIGVLEHPFYAVSGSDGSFALDGLPAGEYVVEAWHERYGTMVDTVSLAVGDTAEVSFTYSADMAGNPVPLGEPFHPHAHETGSEDGAAPGDGR
jgi:plastocyanin